MVVKSRGKSPKCLSIENKIFRYNEAHAREAMSTVEEKPPIYFSYCDEKQAILNVDTVLSRTHAVGFHYETYGEISPSHTLTKMLCCSVRFCQFK